MNVVVDSPERLFGRLDVQVVKIDHDGSVMVTAIWTDEDGGSHVLAEERFAQHMHLTFFVPEDFHA